MKFLRLLWRCLALAAALVVILAAALCVPAVQTWVAQWALTRQSAAEASLVSLSAGWEKIEVADLRIKWGGAVLTFPSLTADVPLLAALRREKIQVRKWVAKGFTLDLSGIFTATDAENATGTGSPDLDKTELAQEVLGALRETLVERTLPYDFSLDGVDLEGDVLVAWPAGRPPSRIHLVITGGGMAAGREGSFTIDASSALLDSDFTLINVAGHGRLALAMSGPRAFNLVGGAGEFSASGGPFPKGITISAQLAKTAAGRTVSLSLVHGGRPVASLAASLPGENRPWEGTWKLEVRDSDFTAFAQDHPLPSFAATGEGRFDAAPDFARAHAQGRLSLAASGLGVLAAPLDRLGATTLKAEFDATRDGPSIRVDRLAGSLAGTRPLAVFRSLQPFTIDTSDAGVKPADSARDWMAISIQGFPLASLSQPADGLVFAGGELTGELAIRAAAGGFALRSLAPLHASDVSLKRGALTLLRKLGLSLSLSADRGPPGWQIQAAPLTMDGGGQRLVTVEAKLSRSTGADQSLVFTGKWNADLQALAAQTPDPDLRNIGGRSASGDLSAIADGSVEWQGNLVLTGRDSANTVTASAHAIVDPDGTMAFQVPLKFAFGSDVSDLSADGTWTVEEGGPRLALRLTGQKVRLDHLRLLAASLGEAGIMPAGLLLPSESNSGLGASRSTLGRDDAPFWGTWGGRISFAFDQLTASEQVLAYVGGSVQANHNSLELQDGRFRLSGERAGALDGSLVFDPGASAPYTLGAQGSLDHLEAASLFPAPPGEEEPPVTGKFSIAGTWTGNGINRDDLTHHLQEQFQLTSKDGIVRLLKTDVSEAIPQAKSSAISEGLGAVGSALGGIFGVKKDSINSGVNPITPKAQAAIDVTLEMAEIGYDQLTMSAVREPGGTIRLTDITMTAPEERFTGSGQIAGAKDLPFREEPLSVDLQLWTTGRIAKLFAATGLLSDQKDGHGYAELIQPIHLQGTLGHIDATQWHKLLVNATRAK